MAEKRLFDYVVETIKYHQFVRPPILIESIFFWLVGQNLLIRPPMNLNCTKSKSYNRNSNLSNRVDISNRVDNKISWADSLSPIDSIWTKRESHSNYYNIYNVMSEKIFFMGDI